MNDSTRPGDHLELDYLTVEAGADGIVRVRVREDGSLEDVEDMFAQLAEFLRARAPARLVSDATAFSTVTWADRWKLAQGLRQIGRHIARSAVVGLPPSMAFTAQVIVRGSGRTNMRFFEDESAALDWLGEPLVAAS